MACPIFEHFKLINLICAYANVDSVLTKKLLRQHNIKNRKEIEKTFYLLAYMSREMDENDNLFYGDPIAKTRYWRLLNLFLVYQS